MPANLPPQYYETEKRFRAAKDPAEKIAILEEMLAIMPKHKGTDHLKAELRGRIAKLTQSLGKKAAGHRSSMTIEKEGAAQIAVIGLPNIGKSQLVSAITNASPGVADYPFTTWNATPGMMPYENIQIQLIDTPPLAPQSIDFWVPPMLRRADALLVMVDLGDAPINQLESITEQLENMRIIFGERTADEEQEGAFWQKKMLIIGNKIDLENANGNYTTLKSRYGEQLPVIAVSAREGIGLEELKHEIYRVLSIIRVYTKTPGQKPDLTDPIIMGKGSTLEDAATAVHKDFASNLKYARIWGSGKHDGLMIKRNHVLEDGDIIELHM
ncbi:GTPase [Chloroflexota bacterium]